MQVGLEYNCFHTIVQSVTGNLKLLMVTKKAVKLRILMIMIPQTYNRLKYYLTIVTATIMYQHMASGKSKEMLVFT